jgi:hypothetical protein
MERLVGLQTRILSGKKNKLTSKPPPQKEARKMPKRKSELLCLKF